jgi:hypothetical protein
MAGIDEQEYKKNKMLEALENLNKKRLEEREALRQEKILNRTKSSPRAESELFKNLDPYKDKGVKVKGSDADKVIDTRQTQRIIPANELKNKTNIATGTNKLRKAAEAAKAAGDQAGLKRATSGLQDMLVKAKKLGLDDAFKKGMKGGLKAVPLVGGIASALMSGDASASIPILGDVDSLEEKPISQEEADMIERTDPLLGSSRQKAYNQQAERTQNKEEADKLQEYLKRQALLAKIR